MAILLPDARELSDDVLEAARLRALCGCELGLTEVQVAGLLGVARETVCRWWAAYAVPRRARFATALPLRVAWVRAAPSPTPRPNTSSNSYAPISPKNWASRRRCGPAVPSATLIRKEFDLDLAERTVGRYPGAPMGLRRTSVAVTPVIKTPKRSGNGWRKPIRPSRARANREGAEIHWGDEGRSGREPTAPREAYARAGGSRDPGCAGPAHPSEPNLDDHEPRRGSVHDLHADDDGSPVPGVPGPAVAEHNGESVPDRGPACGALPHDPGSAGVGGGASGAGIEVFYLCRVVTRRS